MHGKYKSCNLSMRLADDTDHEQEQLNQRFKSYNSEVGHNIVKIKIEFPQ